MQKKVTWTRYQQGGVSTTKNGSKVCFVNCNVSELQEESLLTGMNVLTSLQLGKTYWALCHEPRKILPRVTVTRQEAESIVQKKRLHDRTTLQQRQKKSATVFKSMRESSFVSATLSLVVPQFVFCDDIKFYNIKAASIEPAYYK